MQPGGEKKKQRSTLRHVRSVREDPDPKNPSWHNLVAKVDRFLRLRFSRRSRRSMSMEELRSEVYLRILRGLPRYEPQEGVSFWSWFRTLADHAAIDLARARKIEGVDDEVGSLQDSRLQTPSRVLRAREVHDALHACLSELRPETARVLELRLFEGLKHEEIAVRVNRKHVTVRAIFVQGRKKLERCLAQRGISGSVLQ